MRVPALRGGARWAVAAGVILLLTRCAPTHDTSVVPSARPCGKPTQLEQVSQGYGVPAGPLWFFPAVGKRQTTGQIRFVPGVPTKIPIEPKTLLQSSVSLRGWRCSDGKPLRFWYKAGLPFAPIPNAAALEKSGDVLATLEPSGSRDGVPVGYTGYLLFTSSGKWNVSVSQQGHPDADVVFDVTTRGSAAG